MSGGDGVVLVAAVPLAAAAVSVVAVPAIIGYAVYKGGSAAFDAYERAQERKRLEAERREIISCRSDFMALIEAQKDLRRSAEELEVELPELAEWDGSGLREARTSLYIAEQQNVYLDNRITEAKRTWEADKDRLTTEALRRRVLNKHAAGLRILTEADVEISPDTKPSETHSRVSTATSKNDEFEARIEEEQSQIDRVTREIAVARGLRAKLANDLADHKLDSSVHRVNDYPHMSLLNESRQQLKELNEELAAIESILDEAFQAESIREADVAWEKVRPALPMRSRQRSDEPWRKGLRIQLNDYIGRLPVGLEMASPVRAACQEALEIIESTDGKDLVATTVRKAIGVIEDYLDMREQVRAIGSELQTLRDTVFDLSSPKLRQVFMDAQSDYLGHGPEWTEQELKEWFGERLSYLRQEVNKEQEWLKAYQEELAAKRRNRLARQIVADIAKQLNCSKQYEIVGAEGLSSTIGLEDLREIGRAERAIGSSIGFIARKRGDSQAAVQVKISGDDHVTFSHLSVASENGQRPTQVARHQACERFGEEFLDCIVEPYFRQLENLGHSVNLLRRDRQVGTWYPTLEERQWMRVRDAEWEDVTREIFHPRSFGQEGNL